MENIHRALVLKHLTDDADGTKSPAAAASVPGFVTKQKCIKNLIKDELNKVDFNMERLRLTKKVYRGFRSS